MKRQLRQWRPPRFHWHEGNHFEWLVDGAQFLPRMLKAIEHAQRSIELEMYLVSSGQVWQRFTAALIAAAQRGVTVRVLLDDYGCQDLSVTDRSHLLQHGVQLQWFNELRWHKGLGNLLRNHRKLLLVDQRLAFVGGAGLTDEFDGPHSTHERSWREVMLSVEGPVTRDWAILFERTWHGLTTRWFKTPSLPPHKIVGSSRGRVCASQGLRGHHISQSLYAQLRTARTRIWLTTPYFLPSLQLRYLLIQAARRGVQVRLLVPGQHTDHPAIRHASRRFFALLLKQGIQIYEYQPRFIHAKVALVDDWLSVGSSNFDRWNLRWNLDANQEVSDAQLADQVRLWFELNFAQSVSLNYQRWQQRPLYLRLLEWATGTLDHWLDKLRHR